MNSAGSWHGGFFQPINTLCYKEILVSRKIRVLPSGTFSLTPDFKKFCHGISMAEGHYQGGCSERDKLDHLRST